MSRQTLVASVSAEMPISKISFANGDQCEKSPASWFDRGHNEAHAPIYGICAHLTRTHAKWENHRETQQMRDAEPKENTQFERQCDRWPCSHCLIYHQVYNMSTPSLNLHMRETSNSNASNCNTFFGYRRQLSMPVGQKALVSSSTICCSLSFDSQRDSSINRSICLDFPVPR